MRISMGTAASNTGRKRHHNEDAYVFDPPLFAVADGMGGARAGELASSIAASALREATITPTEGPENLVVELIQGANQRVHQRAVSDTTASGMGTTMTVALFRSEGSVVIGHVGDSRAYLLRQGELAQLTEDHSLVAELVRRGELSPEQAEVHPQRSVITRALGTEPEVDVDAFTVEAREGDVFLLCSDGLTTMVDPGTIAQLIHTNRFDLEAASRALIRVANDRGGEDNITTVLFAIAGDGTGGGDGSTPAAGGGFEDEDTLHPGEVPTVEAAMVVPLTGFDEPAADGLVDADPGSLTVIESPAAPRSVDVVTSEPRVPPVPLPLGRLILTLALIVALSALTVFLIIRGFAQ
jgi:serine/threonine protein phosphatase PrpC